MRPSNVPIFSAIATAFAERDMIKHCLLLFFLRKNHEQIAIFEHLKIANFA